MSPSVYCGLNPSLGAISSVLNFSAIYHLFDVILQFYLIDCPQATGLIFIKLKQIMGLGCVPVYSPPPLASLCTKTQCLVLFVASKASCGPACFLFTFLPVPSPLLPCLALGSGCPGSQAFIQTTLDPMPIPLIFPCQGQKHFCGECFCDPQSSLTEAGSFPWPSSSLLLCNPLACLTPGPCAPHQPVSMRAGTVSCSPAQAPCVAQCPTHEAVC